MKTSRLEDERLWKLEGVRLSWLCEHLLNDFTHLAKQEAQLAQSPEQMESKPQKQGAKLSQPGEQREGSRSGTSSTAAHGDSAAAGACSPVPQHTGGGMSFALTGTALDSGILSGLLSTGTNCASTSASLDFSPNESVNRSFSDDLRASTNPKTDGGLQCRSSRSANSPASAVKIGFQVDIGSGALPLEYCRVLKQDDSNTTNPSDQSPSKAANQLPGRHRKKRPENSYASRRLRQSSSLPRHAAASDADSPCKRPTPAPRPPRPTLYPEPSAPVDHTTATLGPSEVERPRDQAKHFETDVNVSQQAAVSRGGERHSRRRRELKDFDLQVDEIPQKISHGCPRGEGDRERHQTRPQNHSSDFYSKDHRAREERKVLKHPVVEMAVTSSRARSRSRTRSLSRHWSVTTTTTCDEETRLIPPSARQSGELEVGRSQVSERIRICEEDQREGVSCDITKHALSHTDVMQISAPVDVTTRSFNHSDVIEQNFVTDVISFNTGDVKVLPSTSSIPSSVTQPVPFRRGAKVVSADALNSNSLNTATAQFGHKDSQMANFRALEKRNYQESSLNFENNGTAPNFAERYCQRESNWIPLNEQSKSFDAVPFTTSNFILDADVKENERKEEEEIESEEWMPDVKREIKKWEAFLSSRADGGIEGMKVAKSERKSDEVTSKIQDKVSKKAVQDGVCNKPVQDGSFQNKIMQIVFVDQLVNEAVDERTVQGTADAKLISDQMHDRARRNPGEEQRSRRGVESICSDDMDDDVFDNSVSPGRETFSSTRLCLLGSKRSNNEMKVLSNKRETLDNEVVAWAAEGLMYNRDMSLYDNVRLESSVNSSCIAKEPMGYFNQSQSANKDVYSTARNTKDGSVYDNVGSDSFMKNWMRCTTDSLHEITRCSETLDSSSQSTLNDRAGVVIVEEPLFVREEKYEEAEGGMNSVSGARHVSRGHIDLASPSMLEAHSLSVLHLEGTMKGTGVNAEDSLDADRGMKESVTNTSIKAPDDALSSKAEVKFLLRASDTRATTDKGPVSLAEKPITGVVKSLLAVQDICRSHASESVMGAAVKKTFCKENVEHKSSEEGVKLHCSSLSSIHLLANQERGLINAKVTVQQNRSENLIKQTTGKDERNRTNTINVASKSIKVAANELTLNVVKAAQNNVEAIDVANMNLTTTSKATQQQPYKVFEEENSSELRQVSESMVTQLDDNKTCLMFIETTNELKTTTVTEDLIISPYTPDCADISVITPDDVTIIYSDDVTVTVSSPETKQEIRRPFDVTQAVRCSVIADKSLKTSDVARVIEKFNEAPMRAVVNVIENTKSVFCPLATEIAADPLTETFSEISENTTAVSLEASSVPTQKLTKAKEASPKILYRPSEPPALNDHTDVTLLEEDAETITSGFILTKFQNLESAKNHTPGFQTQEHLQDENHNYCLKSKVSLTTLGAADKLKTARQDQKNEKFTGEGFGETFSAAISSRSSKGIHKKKGNVPTTIDALSRGNSKPCEYKPRRPTDQWTHDNSEEHYSEWTVETTSAKELSGINPTVTVHEFGEMYSVFSTLPAGVDRLRRALSVPADSAGLPSRLSAVGAADRALREEVAARYNSSAAVQRLLSRYPALRPGTWQWSSGADSGTLSGASSGTAGRIGAGTEARKGTGAGIEDIMGERSVELSKTRTKSCGNYSSDVSSIFADEMLKSKSGEKMKEDCRLELSILSLEGLRESLEEGLAALQKEQPVTLSLEKFEFTIERFILIH